MLISLVIGVQYWLSNDYGELPAIEPDSTTTVSELPDFTAYNNVQEKKQAFFELLYPIIEEENAHLLSVRAALTTLPSADNLTDVQRRWLADLATYYSAANNGEQPITVNTALIENLLVRIDYIPPSLALTQAAIESGWGTSRFSKEGNNLFGQWCFVKGCGIVPNARASGRYHEVATFKTVNHAVRAYLRNLNSHNAYTELRSLRAQLRSNQNAITGKALAPSLGKYSEEGKKYIQKVSQFIDYNNLQRYTKRFEAQVVKT